MAELAVFPEQFLSLKAADNSAAQKGSKRMLNKGSWNRKEKERTRAVQQE